MKTLTLQQARQAVDYALHLAQDVYAQRPLSVAVSDANGDLLAFARMDGAKLLTIELTQRKPAPVAVWAAPLRRFYSACKPNSWISATLATHCSRRCRAAFR